MNPRFQFTALIFDMDGLMLDTERIARSAWQRAMSDWNATLPDALYLQLIGRDEQGTVAILQEAYGEEFPVRQVRQRKQQYFEEDIVRHGVPMKPGLMELLDLADALSQRKAVASSTETEPALRKLALAGIAGRFDAIVCGDQVQNGKPAPDIFLEAAARLGVAPEQCLVLEDSEPGVRAAHAAGMLAIMVPDLKPPSEDVEALAYRVLPSLHHVRAFLEETVGAARDDLPE